MNENKSVLFINRCLHIASFAQGKTSPNPLVGAVIVYNDKIIGEGYHQFYGGTHAEVNAVNSVKEPNLLCKSTLYVNFEPCSHFGKTPPCADLIIEKKIPRVVIGMLDPNPKVNGKGVEKLRNAGVEVIVGIEEKKCCELNKIFITNIEKKRPYILLKWAQTADGFIDNMRQGPNIEPLKISNGITKTLNHQIRTQYSAILVGTKTALLDNPHLSARKFAGNSPVRTVIDKNLVLPHSYNIFDNSERTVIFNSVKNLKEKNIDFFQINFSENIIPQILNYLQINKLSSLIVEGGQQLLESFIKENLWDECHIETSQQRIINGIPAPIFPKKNLQSTIFYEENLMQVFVNNANQGLKTIF
jgi:diaminohydroxyphosphoribosylaminopyrimidine deaminase/5-amino-6-(5-phosphoribosylamino)uracil reductase